MKAIFLANNKGNIDYVYAEENINRVASLCDIEKDKVYTEEEILANPEPFKDVEYIFSTWSMPGGGEIKLIDYLPNVKALFYAAGSVRYFANEYFEKGVRIFSAYAANAIPVAEFTVGQILLASKGYFQSSALAKSGDYKKASEVSLARVGNYGANIGIIGAGMIGRKVIELLKPYKLNILVFDVFMTEEQAEAMGVKKCSLEEIFSSCHIVSNHLANVPATQGILKKEHFEMMMPNATFINTGRGAQVDEEGMLEVYERRSDLCALLDVTISEPPVEGSKFYTLPNIFLSPHIAGSQGWEVRRMAELVIDEFENYLNGRPTLYEITPEKLAKMA
ncbi:MAG: hydroxyacid dehydrogenase [Clostridia bacterium]|nr:hydroxyacid dehydrogenase [Clostridia bacterium]